ncbi:hypothetical protein GCM10009118_07740 [Wandonia haliotis]|uniref:Uncharacterized protein n=1 Tax=Wandonia haliotis TaxID=574963 RepID=A0ABN1MM65_9FLAO
MKAIRFLIIIIFVLGVNINSSYSQNTIEEQEVNDSISWSGCLLFYGGQFYFYPNISSSQMPMILSNSSSLLSFKLTFICNQFLFKRDLDFYFSTIETEKNHPKSNLVWHRIHFTDVEIKFKTDYLLLKDKVMKQTAIINNELVYIEFVGSIYGAIIDIVGKKNKSGNSLFIEDTKSFAPGVLRFDCGEDSQDKSD